MWLIKWRKRRAKLGRRLPSGDGGNGLVNISTSTFRYAVERINADRNILPRYLGIFCLFEGIFFVLFFTIINITNLWWILWFGSEVLADCAGQCRASLWSLYPQIPSVCSNREDPAPGLLSRLQASVSPPTEWSRGSLRSGVRNHQHSHPVHLWRHGDPAHRD